MTNSTKEWIGVILITLVVIVVFGAVPFIQYSIDKASCYDKAKMYGTEVQKYSWLKNYCFIEKDGKNINLEQYREVFNN